MRRISILALAACAIFLPSQILAFDIHEGSRHQPGHGTALRLRPDTYLQEQRSSSSAFSVSNLTFEVHGAQTPEEEAADKAQRDINTVTYKLTHFGDIMRETRDKQYSNFKSFFPGWTFDYRIFVSVIMTMFIGLTWFLIYYNFLYKTDRIASDHVEMWKDKLEIIDNEDYGEFNPDMIIVFHHPNFNYEDNDEEVSLAQITEVMVQSGEFEESFPELAEARGYASDDTVALMKRKAARMSKKVSENLDGLMRGMSTSSNTQDAPAPADGSTTKSQGDAEQGSPSHLTIRSARMALLKDLYKYLHKHGFEMTAFHSIDVDELFVCASLKHTHTINSMLARDHKALPICSAVVAGLTDQHKPVVQDASDPTCAPPLVPYEPPLMKTLYKEEITNSEDEIEVFKTFKRFGTKAYISSNMAIQLVMGEVSEVLDLEAAQDHGMIVAWFPVHSTHDVDKFTAIWGNFRALTDLNFVQPIPDLRDYFGARIAFLFAWNGVYAKALGVLLMTAVFWLMVTLVAKFVFKSTFFNERQVIGFAITLSIWCRVANNMWCREENWFLEFWGMKHGSTDGGHSVRPSFHGEMAPSPLNSNIQEKQYPKHLALARLSFSATATIAFCIIAAGIIWTWMTMFEGKMGPVSAIILSVIIKVFQIIFQLLVKQLVEFENHKFAEDYFNSYLWKLFLFEYVNNYSAFFFMTLRGADMSFCQGDPATCKIKTLQLLRSQVSMTMIVLVICSVLQVITQTFTVKFKLWYEDYQYRKTFKKEPPPRSSHEEQAKLGKIDDATEVQNMMTLVIALGFVFHFGGVAPLAMVFSFVLFSVQLRAFAMVLLTAQRVQPHRAEGIGNWAHVLNYLMVSGVVYTAFMVVVYGAAFGEAPQLAKLSAFVLFCCGIFIAWKLVDVVFPCEDEDVELLHDRRNYVAKLLMKLEHKDELSHLEVSTTHEEGEILNAIEGEDFGKISGRMKTPKPSMSEASDH